MHSQVRKIGDKLSAFSLMHEADALHIVKNGSTRFDPVQLPVSVKTLKVNAKGFKYPIKDVAFVNDEIFRSGIGSLKRNVIC